MKPKNQKVAHLMKTASTGSAEMKCKFCGADEDRIKGFCSEECRAYHDYQKQISELEADKDQLEKHIEDLLTEHLKELTRLGLDLLVAQGVVQNIEPLIRFMENKDFKE